MSVNRADALVFFGATGDLAYKKIFPALHALVARRRLEIPVIGVAKEEWSIDRLRMRAEESLRAHDVFDAATFPRLASLLRYVSGDYRDPATFASLRDALGSARRPLHYLAIPPSMFATVVEGLATSGCVNDARVVVEKPFGRDLASARRLSTTLHRFLPESSIYRIDHYLGKEPVLNLIYFRFANALVEAGWDKRHIDSVQITMAETFGVSGRGSFYEEVGAIRDVVQNHMLRVVACLAMECPASNEHASQGDERARLLACVRTLDRSDVVRGQYAGYRSEPGVAVDSQVETYAAARLFVDNDRWQGVPFYVRAGKRLPVTVTEVLVRLKRPSRPVLDETLPPQPNHYRFRLHPEMVLALGTEIKKPGEAMVGEPIELMAHERRGDQMEPYERLLGDALNGDPTLFTRQDAVESSWRVVDPVLGGATPLFSYEANTWGPTESNRLLSQGSWHEPKASHVSQD